MRFFLGLSANVAVAGLLLSTFGVVASAQSPAPSSDVPTFSQALPPPIVGEPDEPEAPPIHQIAPPT
ncbi:MAG TPA: hypothetical protein PLF26_09360, partial [Blastocatellia bacterium]|nr:hypothetical protein [Blastocatellia bacterium]